MANIKPLLSSKTGEHYTPQRIIDAVIQCLGGIELDACSNCKIHPNVPALRHFTIEDDGLAQHWKAETLYLNPPYGRKIGKWVEKLVSHYEAGDVIEAITLVPSRTDTKWYRMLRDYPVCSVSGRLKFVGSKKSAPFPSAVFYLGTSLDKFYDVFSPMGDIWRRYRRS